MPAGPQLHRSLTFWAGLLLIIFTCWAWWDSDKHVTSIHGQYGRIESSVYGLTFFSWPKSGHTKWFTHRTNLPTNESTLNWRSHLFPRPFSVRYISGQDDGSSDWTILKNYRQWEASISGPRSWTLFIPYWLILLLITLPWLTLLVLRARRHRRAKLLHSP